MVKTIGWGGPDVLVIPLHAPRGLVHVRQEAPAVLQAALTSGNRHRARGGEPVQRKPKRSAWRRVGRP